MVIYPSVPKQYQFYLPILLFSFSLLCVVFSSPGIDVFSLAVSKGRIKTYYPSLSTCPLTLMTKGSTNYKL